MFSFLSEFPHGSVVILIVGIWFIFEMVARILKSAMKQRIYSQYDNEKDPEAWEFYLQHYRKSQIVDIVRILGFLLAIGSLIVYAVPGAFSFLAIATGAMILTFKDAILSFMSFFYIIAHFKVGDTIGVSGARGEIIYIRFLNVWLVGRDANTEHTGTLHVVPNSRFILDIVQKEELSSASYRLEQIEIPFDPHDFHVSFEVFLKNLENFLSKNLKVRSIKQVGNYRSFAGTAYKLDFTYTNRGKMMVTVQFVGKAWHLSDATKNIVVFIESMRGKVESAEISGGE